MATTEAIDVVMPQMGVSVSEGTITKWLKQQGEQVEADEPLLEISTDKVDTEVPSPGTGLLTEILVQEGQTVDVGTKLAVIGGDGASASPPAPAEEAPPEPATQAAADEAAKQLESEGLSVEILDLRTLAPWDKAAVLESARKTSKVLVLHEDTRTGGFGAEIAATIAEEAFEDLDAPVKRIAAPDTPVPFSPPLEKAFIPQVDDVTAGLRELAEY